MKRKPGPELGTSNRRSTGDSWLDLLAAVIHQAIRDARKGNKPAAVWLWTVAPSVAGPAIDGERTHRKPQDARDGAQRYKQTTKRRSRDFRAFGGVGIVKVERLEHELRKRFTRCPAA